MADFSYPPIQFQTNPSRYNHWEVSYSEDIATVRMNVQMNKPMWDNRYELKLNSYDLSVDIELNDIVQRMRFEHPNVRCVVVTGGQDKIFCAGANIPMLGGSPHAFKVNFCKYTNETRCSIEDASNNSGQIWIAALNGTASGGGYELALACEKIYLIDDGNSAVSLPEVPLLGVLPGTGGLTRLTDKRRIRKDIADIFCTKAEGFRARDAKKFNLIDGSFPRSKWAAGIQSVSNAIAAKQPSKPAEGVVLPEIQSEQTDTGWTYRFVTVAIDGHTATLTIQAPNTPPSRDANTWSLRAFRELEDALLKLRFNHLDIGVILLKSHGDQASVLEHEAWVESHAQSDWFVNEIQLFQQRTLRKVDNMAKSLFALIEMNHCFVGILFEIALAADRSYMFLDDDDENCVQLSNSNYGTFPMANGKSRVFNRFFGDQDAIDTALSETGPIDASTAEEIGLVTLSLDDIDYDDEVRIAIEERESYSPDALTGMEQNLRFGGAESCETKIYGRLSAWQNWIFQRPNAVGKRGALTMYGHPEQPIFDYRRT